MEDNNLRVIKVNKEDSDALEALQFEVNGYKSLLDFMISGGSSINTNNFRSYHNEYIEKNTEYEVAKRAFSQKYFGDWIDRCEWNLDFESATVTVRKVK